MKVTEHVTQTAKALPVTQEWAQMTPKRKRERKRSVGIAVVAWAIGGGILHFLPGIPWYFGAAVIAYGFAAFDSRLFADFFKYPIQLIAALRGGSSEAP